MTASPTKIMASYPARMAVSSPRPSSPVVSAAARTAGMIDWPGWPMIRFSPSPSSRTSPAMLLTRAAPAAGTRRPSAMRIASGRPPWAVTWSVIILTEGRSRATPAAVAAR